MTHGCERCGAAFESEVDLAIHRDRCTDGELFCDDCGDRFREADATDDGWTYRCPNEDCDAEGIGDELYPVENVRVAVQ